MKAVILASMLALTALACTVPTRSANAGACPGNPMWCDFTRGPPRFAICMSADTPQNDPFLIAGSWVVRREGQPFHIQTRR